MPIQCFRFILLLLFAATASQGWATNHIVASAYFEDTSRTLTLAQVQQQTFTPYKGMLTKGFTSSAIWLRLRLDPKGDIESSPFPAGQEAERFILRIQPQLLDEVALFDPLEPSDRPRLAGDRYSWNQLEYKSLNLNFVIPRGDVPRDLWLRLQTTSTSLISVEALSLSEVQKNDRRMELIYSLFLAMQLVFTAWALLHWSAQRDRVVGVFVLKQLVAILFSLAYMGYTRIFLADVLPASWLDIGTSLCILGYVAAIIFFDYNLLREYLPPRSGLRFLLMLMTLFPVGLVLILAGKAQMALSANLFIVVLEPVLALGLAIMAAPRHRALGEQAPVISQRILVGYYALILVSLSALSLPVLGLFSVSGLVLTNFLFHGLITGVLMVAMLQVRTRRLEARSVQVQAALTLSEQQAQQERAQRLEQSNFLSMLTHELKTSLTVMRLVLGAKTPTPDLVDHAKRAVSDMNSLIERCLQVDKLEDKQVAVTMDTVDLCHELHELQRNGPPPAGLNLDLTANIELRTDARILRIVLANLLDNAFKYSAAGRTVDVLTQAQTRGAQAGVTITIQNMPGVAGWPDAKLVFQKYYRSQQAHHQSGSGLGLYLVKHMAQLLGGEVRYEPDKTFVRFTLWHPL